MQFGFLAAVTFVLLSWGHLIVGNIVDLHRHVLEKTELDDVNQQ